MSQQPLKLPGHKTPNNLVVWSDKAIVVNPIICSTMLGIFGISGPTHFCYSLVFILLLAISQLLAARSSTSLEEVCKLQSDRQYAMDTVRDMASVRPNLFQGYLAIFYNKLGFSEFERISLFEHQGDTFVLIGRFSSRPEFCSYSTRVYPTNQGCIVRTWQGGSHFSEELPDFEQQKEAYEQACLEYNLKPNDIDSLSMKSRQYYGKAIKNQSGVNAAILMFESLKIGVLDRRKIERLLDEPECNKLTVLLEKTRGLGPNFADKKANS